MEPGKMVRLTPDELQGVVSAHRAEVQAASVVQGLERQLTDAQLAFADAQTVKAFTLLQVRLKHGLKPSDSINLDTGDVTPGA